MGLVVQVMELVVQVMGLVVQAMGLVVQITGLVVQVMGLEVQVMGLAAPSAAPRQRQAIGGVPSVAHRRRGPIHQIVPTDMNHLL